MTTAKRRASRASLAFAAAFGALVIASGTVSAATELKTSGNIGQYTINEAEGDVLCSYELGGGYLNAIAVVAPDIYARSKTAGVDQQQVGWRVVVKSRPQGAPPQPTTTLFTSAVFKSNATDATPATLLPIKLQMAFPGDSTFIVYIKAFWYRADGSVAGFAKSRVDNYTSHHPNLNEWPNESCSSFGA